MAKDLIAKLVLSKEDIVASEGMALEGIAGGKTTDPIAIPESHIRRRG
jgi:hypothetical protein